MATQKKKKTFGTTRKLMTGIQARYSFEGRQITLGVFPTQKLADQELAKVQADIARDMFVDQTKGLRTFGDFAQEAMAHRRLHLKAGTISNDMSNLNLRILPEFENVQLRKITKGRMHRFLDSLGDQPNVRRNCYTTFSAILTLAVERDELAEKPRVKGASKATARPPKTFSVDDFKSMLNVASSDFRVVLWTMFSAHLRLGELRGLVRSDVDLENGTLLIERQLKAQKVTTTKTGDVRKVDLLQPGLDALKEYLKKNPKLPSAPLFTTYRGTRMSESYFYRTWHDLQKLARQPDMVPHSIRHISLAFCGHSSMSIEEVAKRAGHRDIRMTLKYMSSNEERMREAAAFTSQALVLKLA